MWCFLCTLLVAVSFCSTANVDLDQHWKSFKLTFNKFSTSTKNELLKKAVWEDNVQAILKHNLEANLGQHTYEMGINEFTDMSDEEFAENFLGLDIPLKITPNYPPKNFLKSARSLPENFDWRDKGVVTRAKSQGGCGSCWAFATTGAIEGAFGIKTGTTVELSEQQLVDCRNNEGKKPCRGGWPNSAFKRVAQRGIVSAECYPYKAKQSECSFNSSCVQTTISKHYDVPKNETTLQEYLHEHGPISVCVSVNRNFNSYRSGILDDPTCMNPVNHAVLLVGYGTENGVDYWTIKNSWGPKWGEKGYIRIARNKNNMCNIVKHASFPVIE